MKTGFTFLEMMDQQQLATKNAIKHFGVEFAPVPREAERVVRRAAATAFEPSSSRCRRCNGLAGTLAPPLSKPVFTHRFFPGAETF